MLIPNSLQYGVIIELKDGGYKNYRKVLEFSNIDACDVLKKPDNYPFLKNGIENFKKFLPGIIQKCPYKVTRTYFQKACVILKVITGFESLQWNVWATVGS